MTTVPSAGHVRAWPTQRSPRVYPEQAPTTGASGRPSTGLCVSGGSTRAYAAAIGQLRGLTAIGLIPRLGYLSSVSGGAWAAGAYTYYAGPGESDIDVLGRYEPPGAISVDGLAELSPAAIGYAATLDFSRALRESHSDRSVARGEVWSRAVGQTYLAPYGLYDPGNPVGFTLDARGRDAILARNPSLQGRGMHTVRDPKRPYWLAHASLGYPAEGGRRVATVGFEFSPLAVGSAQLLTIDVGGGETHRVGGGFIESFALGCSAPASVPDAGGVVEAELPPHPLTLADAIGASSAFSSPDRDPETYPHVRYWPVVGDVDGVASSRRLTDGGDVENYGLLPLLGRRVRAAVVCINTVWPLSLDYDPATWPDSDANPEVTGEPRVIDPFLAPLFGEPSLRFRNNHVFAETDYAAVVADLQAAKQAGRTVMTVRTHTVRSNPWWGIDGGWDVQICWLYNERVAQWEDQLRPEVRRLVAEGRGAAPSGPVQHFPHYLTRGQNPGALIRLTPSQVNLLAHLSSWNVVANADAFRSLLV